MVGEILVIHTRGSMAHCFSTSVSFFSLITGKDFLLNGSFTGPAERYDKTIAEQITIAGRKKSYKLKKIK